MHSYCNQKMRIKWNSALSGTFNTCNGVKQGGVLSPLLFTIYLDRLILSLKDLGVGCHLNGMFVGAFSYADDVTLLAPTYMALKATLNTCTEFAASHNLLFNASKTKCMYFNDPRSQAHSAVEFMGTAIDFVDCAALLRVSICCDVKDRNINRSVQKFYCKVNSVLYDFKDIPCDIPCDILYNSLIMPHFNYCHLVWGCNIHEGHKLHLLQKKALRIITNSHCIAHSEPLCKRLRVVKVIDMFEITLWKFYYKFMNNMLPPYFNMVKPNMPFVCDYYGLRNPKIHLPTIRHDFAKQIVQYCLIKLLNKDKEYTPLNKSKIYTQSFFTFKLNLKYQRSTLTHKFVKFTIVKLVA